MGTPDRLNCCTPGCGRSRKNDTRFDEWVCQKCVVRVPPAIRHEHKAAKAQWRKILRTGTETEAEWNSIRDRARNAWEALKNAASGGVPDDDILREIGVI